MTPEQEVKKRLSRVLECRNIEAVSRKTGYPVSTVSRWKRCPVSIPAIALKRRTQKMKKEIISRLLSGVITTGFCLPSDLTTRQVCG